MTLTDKKLTNARIPQRYWGASLSDITDAEVAVAVGAYVQGLEHAIYDGVGILLHGKPGVGKTQIACAVLMSALDQGYTGLFLTLPHLVHLHHKVRDLKDGWMKMGDRDAYQEWITRTEALESLRNEIQFIVIDDVGKEHTTQTQYAEDLFEEIFRSRYDHALPTILTSNMDPAEWSEKYSEAMGDFIFEATPPIHVPTESWRSRS